MRRTLRRIVLILSSFFPALAILLGTLGNWEHKSYLVSFFAAVLLLAFLAFLLRKGLPFTEWLERQDPTVVCLMMSTVCLLLNGIWVFTFHPVQAADYETFFRAASDLANSRPLWGKDYIAMFPHILGYAAFLSVFLRIFGECLMTAALMNVVLTTLSGVMLYLISMKHFSRKTAFLLFLLWTICPSKLLYNTMSLSEPLYTCLLLVFFLLVSKVTDICPGNRQICLAAGGGLLSGLVLAMVNGARPIGIIPIIAFLLWLLFLSEWKEICLRKKAILIYICLLILSYFVAGSMWKTYASARLEQTPPSVPGYSIYVGFNPQTQGSYSDEDMELLQSRYFGEYDRNAEAAQQSMLESARQRIAENKNGIPSLMLHKLRTLLGHDEGGAFYSRESLSDRAYSLWCVVSNTWYYLVCMLAVAGCVQRGKQPEGDCMLIVPLCLIGIVVAQLLVEVAARYHYCLIPMLLLMAAPVLQGRKTERRT